MAIELVKVIYPKGKTDGLLALGVYQVGHVYEVDRTTADQLIAAGFEPADSVKPKSDTADASTASAQPAAGAKK